MALIKCKNCKWQYSTIENNCPHCGAPRAFNRFIAAILIFFSFIFVIMPAISNSLSFLSPQSDLDSSSVIKKPLAPLSEEIINWPVKPEIPSFEKEVFVNAYFVDKNDLTPQIIGYSNLPNETQIMVTVDRKDIDYTDGVNTRILDGKFKTKPFSADGLELPPGKYTIKISTPMPSLQPDKVEEIIGKNGENLKGKNTYAPFGSRSVNYSTRLTLGDGPSKEIEDLYRRAQKNKKQQDQAARESRIPAVRYACQKFVKQQLNDPDSAEFDNAPSYPASVEGNVYTVEVSGRARNGFNALRYVTFRCEAVYMGNDRWIPASIKQISN